MRQRISYDSKKKTRENLLAFLFKNYRQAYQWGLGSCRVGQSFGNEESWRPGYCCSNSSTRFSSSSSSSSSLQNPSCVCVFFLPSLILAFSLGRSFSFSCVADDIARAASQHLIYISQSVGVCVARGSKNKDDAELVRVERGVEQEREMLLQHRDQLGMLNLEHGNSQQPI